MLIRNVRGIWAFAVVTALAGCQAPRDFAASTPSEAVRAAQTVEFYAAQSVSQPGLRPAALPGGTVYLPDRPVLTRVDLTDAAALHDQQGRFFVGLRFTREGAQKLNELSLRHVGKPLALVLDGELVAAPRIAEPLSQGVLSFSVDSAATAEEVAARIRGG